MKRELGKRNRRLDFWGNSTAFRIFFYITRVQSVLGVPDGDAVAMEILLSRAMNFKLHVQLPVLQVTWLRTRNRRQGHETSTNKHRRRVTFWPSSHKPYWYDGTGTVTKTNTDPTALIAGKKGATPISFQHLAYLLPRAS